VPSPPNLRRKLPIWSFGITLAVLMGGALTGYLNARHLIANERRVAHTDSVIVDLTSLLSMLRDAERSQRGYLLTGKDAYLQSYRGATQRVQGELATLTADVRANPGQQARLGTLRQAIALKIAELERTIRLEKAGDGPRALAIVRGDSSKTLMREIRAQVAAMQTHEEGILDQRAGESERSSRATIAAMVAPALIGAALLCLVFYLSNRRVIELNEADRHKDEFLALLGHELRGPLAPLRNGLEIIERSRSAELLRPTCASMQRQLEQLTRLINDLLDASRIAQGKIELRRAPTELGALIQDLVEAERPLARTAGLELEATVPGEPLFVDGDRLRLTQVFRNLLQNARKYTEPGGRIDISLAAERERAVVRVKDTGIGIPSNKLETIFEMFAQIDHSLPSARGGLGIGLGLAKRLLALHGGSIEAFSEGPHRGSEFVARLPLIAAASGRESAQPVPQAVVPSRRILIVDDNMDAASTLAMLLQLADHETYMAHDGLEALEAAERVEPDVIFLDIQLPKLDGYEVCRRIRRQPWAGNIMLVALTGLGMERDKEKSKDAGFDAHLVKPPDYAEVTKLLTKVSRERSCWRPDRSASAW
jgi:signal transduction histidine kinase/ActR/RegA family two-component response regulator